VSGVTSVRTDPEPGRSEASPVRPAWPAGRDPGGQVVALGFALTLSAVAIDLVTSGELSLFFDLCFAASCVLLAWLVRPRDFFTVGVLPPLLMLGVFLLAGIATPDLIAHPSDGVVQAVVSGLSVHAPALVVGYALALATLAYRARRARRPLTHLL
jgi:hypothetical protein